ncbi:mRNA 3'-end-processing protein rna14 [Paramarasmius palmivorus]|uniref:mRNA 3'-end-processing protein rna14 n=1 Tax=Paramarasmius palmivorus TaxID=297713 RepID=A0AAW0BDP3_9AGAR
MVLSFGGTTDDVLDFENGMKLFSKDIDYVTCYLDWVIAVNKKSHSKASLETVADNFTCQEAAWLWDRWSRYLYRCGDLDSIQSAERQIAKLFGTAVDMRWNLSQQCANNTLTRDIIKHVKCPAPNDTYAGPNRRYLDPKSMVMIRAAARI